MRACNCWQKYAIVHAVPVALARVPDAVLAPVANQTGYEPHALDETIARHIAVAEKAIRVAQALEPLVTETVRRLSDAKIEVGTEAPAANQATILFDRMTKASLNLVKAVDELSRLRSFVAGGPDSRPDLSAKGETELRDVLLDALRKLGITPAMLKALE